MRITDAQSPSMYAYQAAGEERSYTMDYLTPTEACGPQAVSFDEGVHWRKARNTQHDWSHNQEMSYGIQI